MTDNILAPTIVTLRKRLRIAEDLIGELTIEIDTADRKFADLQDAIRRAIDIKHREN